MHSKPAGNESVQQWPSELTPNSDFPYIVVWSQGVVDVKLLVAEDRAMVAEAAVPSQLFLFHGVMHKVVQNGGMVWRDIDWPFS